MTAKKEQEQTAPPTVETDGIVDGQTEQTVDQPAAEPTTQTVTVTVAGGRDGLQGVQVIDPATGTIYRPGDTVAVAAHLARDWIANGWVVVADDHTDDAPDQPPAKGRRTGRQRSSAT